MALWRPSSLSGHHVYRQQLILLNRFGHYVRGVQEIVSLCADSRDDLQRFHDGERGHCHDSSRRLRCGGPLLRSSCRWNGTSRWSACGRYRDPRRVKTSVNGWLIQALENVTLTNPRTGEPVLRARFGVVDHPSVEVFVTLRSHVLAASHTHCWTSEAN
jgi:hypothetical protein